MSNTMLGRLIASLDDPRVVGALVANLEDPTIAGRLTAAAEAAGQEQSEIVAAIVRGFIETASNDHWTQLIGIMSRAADPGLAALRAILLKALPPAAGAAT
jgi:hypothetical protein